MLFICQKQRMKEKWQHLQKLGVCIPLSSLHVMWRERSKRGDSLKKNKRRGKRVGTLKKYTFVNFCDRIHAVVSLFVDKIMRYNIKIKNR